MPGTYNLQSPPKEVGETIPANTPHAVSVTLPTWNSNVAYEEGEHWVHSKMRSGYPRFMIHEKIQDLAKLCLDRYGNPSEGAMLFPSKRIAEKARTFILDNSSSDGTTTSTPHIAQLSFPPVTPVKAGIHTPSSAVHLFVLLYSLDHKDLAKAFWQHTGFGISSRMAEYCLLQLESVARLDDSFESIPTHTNGNGWTKPLRRSPYKNRHYAKDIHFGKLTPPTTPTRDTIADSEELTQDQTLYLEERYGRNLDISFAGRAKIALRRRIAGTLRDNVDVNEAVLTEGVGKGRSCKGVDESDVYLFPTGMSAIWTAHQLVLNSLPPKKSVCFGFTYVDTLKILQKWGPGCHFYGHASEEELDELENLLKSGEQVLSLFCEFPSNPLLITPNLKRLRKLADEYHFPIIIDETIGNFINIAVLDSADIVVSSLTKIFSGDSNVMGGSLVLNPHRKYYARLKETMSTLYEDVCWPQDVVFLERNSRDFIPRIHRVNTNAHLVCQTLLSSPHVKRVFYPTLNPSRPHYDAYRTPDGGYGGLLSVVFHEDDHAVTFYDAIETAKGPSLGTNFTLTSPYTILAHYTELEWARRYGVERGLVRISVGLEEGEQIVRVFEEALGAIGKSVEGQHEENKSV